MCNSEKEENMYLTYSNSLHFHKLFPVIATEYDVKLELYIYTAVRAYLSA